MNYEFFRFVFFINLLNQMTVNDFIIILIYSKDCSSPMYTSVHTEANGSERYYTHICSNLSRKNDNQPRTKYNVTNYKDFKTLFRDSGFLC